MSYAPLAVRFQVRRAKINKESWSILMEGAIAISVLVEMALSNLSFFGITSAP